MVRMSVFSRSLIAAAGLGLMYGAIAYGQGTQQTPAPAAPSAQPQAPAAPPPMPATATIAYPGVGPADPKLRMVNLPSGKKLHLLPATLETTQWGWFDNSQAPVLRINSGDTVALETMMPAQSLRKQGTLMLTPVTDPGSESRSASQS